MVKISFLGDISLNNRYTDLEKVGINPFSNIESYLKSADCVVGNLECLASGDEGENMLKNPRLNTNLTTLNLLKYLHLGIVSLAHNHVYDNLKDGFIKSTVFLEENKIKYLGASTDKNLAHSPLFYEKNDIKFCFLNYVSADTHPNLPSETDVYLNYYDKIKIKSDILENKEKVDHVILLLHWGGKVEGYYYPESIQVEDAKEFVQTGASLIVGHHTHTFQPFEVIHGKMVFYSLGNFCFDNVETETELIELDWNKNAESAILNVNFSKHDYSFDLLPIQNVNLEIKFQRSLLSKFKTNNNYFGYIKKSNLIRRIFYLKYKLYDKAIYFFVGNNRNFFKQLRKISIKKVLTFIKYY